MITVRTTQELGITRGGKCTSWAYPKVWGAFHTGEPEVFEGIVNKYKPSRYFEFGTGCGVSVKIVKSAFSGCECFSLDCNDFIETRAGYEHLGDPAEATYIRADSFGHIFCASMFHSFDIVLVDGRHDIAGCANDTARAMDLVKPGGIIIWHDVLITDKYADVFDGQFYKDLKVASSIQVSKYLNEYFPHDVTLIDKTCLAMCKVGG